MWQLRLQDGGVIFFYLFQSILVSSLYPRLTQMPFPLFSPYFSIFSFSHLIVHMNVFLQLIPNDFCASPQIFFLVVPAPAWIRVRPLGSSVPAGVQLGSGVRHGWSHSPAPVTVASRAGSCAGSDRVRRFETLSRHSQIHEVWHREQHKEEKGNIKKSINTKVRWNGSDIVASAVLAEDLLPSDLVDRCVFS